LVISFSWTNYKRPPGVALRDALAAGNPTIVLRAHHVDEGYVNIDAIELTDFMIVVVRSANITSIVVVRSANITSIVVVRSANIT